MNFWYIQISFVMIIIVLNINISIILIEKYWIAIDSSIKVCDGDDNVVLMKPISKYIQSQRHVRVGR